MSQSVPQTINILLGSSSRFRQHLFQSCIPPSNDKYKFNVVQDIKLYPDIDEKAIRRTDPKELTRAITAAKTDKLLELINADSELKKKIDVVVCGDQVIGFQGAIREKPETEEQAKEHLLSYTKSTDPIYAHSCIEVTQLTSGSSTADGEPQARRVIQVDEARLFFKQEPIPDPIIEQVIAKEDILHCAGSIVVEEELLQPYIDRIEGEIETIQGMPKTMTKQILLGMFNK